MNTRKHQDHRPNEFLPSFDIPLLSSSTFGSVQIAYNILRRLCPASTRPRVNSFLILFESYSYAILLEGSRTRHICRQWWQPLTASKQHTATRSSSCRCCGCLTNTQHKTTSEFSRDAKQPTNFLLHSCVPRSNVCRSQSCARVHSLNRWLDSAVVCYTICVWYFLFSQIFCFDWESPHIWYHLCLSVTWLVCCVLCAGSFSVSLGARSSNNLWLG